MKLYLDRTYNSHYKYPELMFRLKYNGWLWISQLHGSVGTMMKTNFRDFDESEFGRL